MTTIFKVANEITDKTLYLTPSINEAIRFANTQKCCVKITTTKPLF